MWYLQTFGYMWSYAIWRTFQCNSTVKSLCEDLISRLFISSVSTNINQSTVSVFRRTLFMLVYKTANSNFPSSDVPNVHSCWNQQKQTKISAKTDSLGDRLFPCPRAPVVPYGRSLQSETGQAFNTGRMSSAAACFLSSTFTQLPLVLCFTLCELFLLLRRSRHA